MSELLVRLTEPPACGLCGSQTLLQVRYPHSWDNTAGEAVQGLKETALCPECHRGRPAADELLALFAVDDQLDPDNTPTFAGLLVAWVEEERQRTVDMTVLETELAAWHAGEL